MAWQPTFGAWIEGEGTRFRVWAPKAKKMDVVLYGADKITSHPLEQHADGFFTGWVAGVNAGARYKYRLGGKAEYPDPASRFQPEGVHGPSEVVGPSHYEWHDAHWKARPLQDLVIYELHVGTFSPEGNFRAVTEKLPLLAETGLTCIELMPVADFPGEYNWGYDGVSLFAPARCYGRPDELRELVDRAHQLGMNVLLDVVYNHFGPDGNYLAAMTPFWTSPRHESPWGAAVNFDAAHSDKMRSLFISNALYWLQEFHFDGLRLDATHAIQDDSHTHFLAELAAEVKEAIPERTIHLIAEDHRNLAHLVKPPTQGGWALDGIWADDFHHQMRRLLAGDHEGYYQDFSGSTEDLAATIRHGWFFSGQESQYLGHARGTDPAGLPPAAFVICLQNHDQIGNRAFGERLHHQIELAAYRAATALLLCVPQTPLLFMGQEWAASSPFLYFTDHHDELGKLVTQGRRKEFRHFSAFIDPKVRETIPDPQASATFQKSKLNWEERAQPPHSGIVNLYQTLLHLRQTEPALRSTDRQDYFCFAASETSVVLVRRAVEKTLLLLCQLKEDGIVQLQPQLYQLPAIQSPWQVFLSTEDARFTVDPHPPQVGFNEGFPIIQFARPGAVILKQ